MIISEKNNWLALYESGKFIFYNVREKYGVVFKSMIFLFKRFKKKSGKDDAVSDLVRGQSMVEMLVAISIVVVSLLGILALVNRALGVNRLVSEQYTGTYLAAEGIEIVKNLFDHSFLIATTNSQNFYGWTNNSCTTSDCIVPGIYEVDYNTDALTPLTCSLLGGLEPTEQALRRFFISPSCNLQKLKIDNSGLYSYNGSTDTKFRRVIVIDDPQEYNSIPQGYRLDYRVTSAVTWESRGGKFMVRLQDYFLPWRIP